MWWTARVGRDYRRGGPPGGGADCAGCPNPARYDPLSGLPHIQAYRLSGDEQTPQALWKRRPPVAEPWPEAMAVSSVFLFVSGPPSGFPRDHESRVMPSRRSMSAGGGGLRRSDSDVSRWSHTRENITLVNRRAHLGARINRHRELQGHRWREHLPATTSPRSATASAGAQPPTKGNQPGSQAASEQCHARRRHRLPGNRQTRGSMRMVSVTVCPALHASPPLGRGRRRRRLSASRPPPRPPAPLRTHSTGPTLQPPPGATLR